MALIIDIKNELIEILDPNGITPDTRHVYFWVNKLIDFLTLHGYSVQRRITADEPFCPQRLSGYAVGFRGEGQCLIWSFYYIWLRIHNPMVPGSYIRNYMMSLTPTDGFNKISMIAQLIYKTI